MLIKKPWIVKTPWMFEGFVACTVWPFIFIREEKMDDKALIEHEMVHYREQRNAYVIPWLYKYFTCKKFRLDAEIRAYKRQIELGGLTAGKAAYLLMRYRLDVSFDEAYALLQQK